MNGHSTNTAVVMLIDLVGYIKLQHKPSSRIPSHYILRKIKKETQFYCCDQFQLSARPIRLLWTRLLWEIGGKVRKVKDTE